MDAALRKVALFMPDFKHNSKESINTFLINLPYIKYHGHLFSSSRIAPPKRQYPSAKTTQYYKPKDHI
jgi:hypothetical protein